MAGKPDENVNSLSEIIEAARTTAEQGIADMQKQADAVIKEGVSQLVAGGAIIAESVRQGVSATELYADRGKAGIRSRRVSSCLGC